LAVNDELAAIAPNPMPQVYESVASLNELGVFRDDSMYKCPVLILAIFVFVLDIAIDPPPVVVAAVVARFEYGFVASGPDMFVIVPEFIAVNVTPPQSPVVTEPGFHRI
jgi:hypothetical protein